MNFLWIFYSELLQKVIVSILLNSLQIPINTDAYLLFQIIIECCKTSSFSSTGGESARIRTAQKVISEQKKLLATDNAAGAAARQVANATAGRLADVAAVEDLVPGTAPVIAERLHGKARKDQVLRECLVGVRMRNAEIQIFFYF